MKYVVGFYFNEAKDEIILIEKQHPEWQKGRFNGVGGKVEAGESIEMAMCREFEEETGKTTETRDWEEFCQLRGTSYSGEPFEIWFLKAFGDFTEITTMTDEEVHVHVVDKIGNSTKVISNLRWLIPMALESVGVIYRIEEI